MVLIPMLGRPHHVAPLLASLDATAPDARPLFLLSPDDTEVHAAVGESGRDFLIVPREPGVGDYARKIHTGYQKSTEPLLFLAASDLRFHPDWLTAALAKLTPGIGVVGTNDLGTARVREGRHATHSLITRQYADEQGTIDGPGILHEGYHHFCVDDELVSTAQHRGAWAMALDAVVEHRHPYFIDPDGTRKAPRDATYNLGASRSAQDKRLYRSRQHLWPSAVAEPAGWVYRNIRTGQEITSLTRRARLDRLPNWVVTAQPAPAIADDPADTTIVVATYGGQEWRDLAAARALPSARAQGCPVLHVHADTLMDARNQGLAQVDTGRVIFLDADDELAPGYLTAMCAGTADLRAPQVAYIRDGRAGPPGFPRVGGHRHQCTGDCLPGGNWLVIGTSAPTDLLRDVGGFRDYAWSEDWDLWYRCHLAGATISGIPGAVYRAHVRADSRNRGTSTQAVKDACFQAIRTDCQTWGEARRASVSV